MIVLTATRIDVYGHFEFKIEGDGIDAAIITRDSIKAAKILFNLGVADPLQRVEHAREWGSVEIFPPHS